MTFKNIFVKLYIYSCTINNNSCICFIITHLDT